MTASKTARVAELRAAAAEASTPAELAQLCASCCSLCAECCQDYIDDPSEANETLCRDMSGLCSEICQRCSDALGGETAEAPPADALADRVDLALAGERMRERMTAFVQNGVSFDLSRCPEQHRERVRQVLAEMHDRRYIRNGMAEAERAAATARDKAAARSRNVEPAPTPEPGPAKLADLIGAMPEAPNTHDGRRYEELAPRQKHDILIADREKFNAMRDDWVARGKPDAGPRDLVGAILNLARACGLDLSDRPAAPQLEVVR